MSHLREIKSLSLDEERRLRAYLEGRALKARQTGAWHPVRALAMVEMFIGSGLRRAELADLRCGDLLIGRGEFAVLVRDGKGHKSRTIGIGQTLKGHLRVFLDAKAARGESVKAEAPLFASERGGGRLDPSAVWRVVNGAYRAVGIRGVTPHSLRHTHARRLLASGADLAEVQAQLGHSSLAVTGIYVQPTLEDRAAAADRMEKMNSQGKKTKVADRLRQTRQSADRGISKLADSET